MHNASSITCNTSFRVEFNIIGVSPIKVDILTAANGGIVKTNNDYTRTMTEKDTKENLERLKAIRAAHRGVITKKVQQVASNRIPDAQRVLGSPRGKQCIQAFWVVNKCV